MMKITTGGVIAIIVVGIIVVISVIIFSNDITFPPWDVRDFVMETFYNRFRG